MDINSNQKINDQNQHAKTDDFEKVLDKESMQEEGKDYKKLLTDAIKKQIIILGPDITLAKVRRINKISVTDDGTVTEINGNPQEVIEELISKFSELSPISTKKTMTSLITN